MKTKKRLISAFLGAAMLLSMIVPVRAWNYTFTSGPNNSDVFDSPTPTDDFIFPNPHENVRRDKNSARTPPPYGAFSGYIPTNAVNPHHRHVSPSTVASAGMMSHLDFPSSAANVTDTVGEAMLPSTVLLNRDGGIVMTEPLFFDDGTMGRLEIPRFNRQLIVRSGATDANLMIGAGHLSSTSAWDGNVVISAHNRGVPNNFWFLTDMRNGDIVIYTTPHGERTYEVVETRQILAEDTSILDWSHDNILTLLTCVAYMPHLRLVVILHEVR